jgi:Fur family peroxide stress response transcriptional regulator
MKEIRNIGIKLTPQRIAIIKYLSSTERHPSADEIFRAVARKYPTMSIATVYNTIDALKEKGYIQELTFDPNKRRFESNKKRHHHLICIKCNDIVDIKDVVDLELHNGKMRDFDIHEIQIAFYGLCKKCRKKGKNNLKSHSNGLHYKNKNRRKGCRR